MYYKELSSDEDSFHDVDSSLNETLEPENIEDEKRLILSKPVGRRLDELTKGLAGCKLDGSAIVFEDSDPEEGFVVGAPVDSGNKAENMPNDPPPVPFDKATGQDGEDVYKKLATLTNKFTKANPKFWFNNFERSIKHFGVKSQITKMEALINLLPPEVTEEVMSFISLSEDELSATPYFDLKTELLKLYGPRPEDSFNKAISRVLVGKPSTLGKQVINDFCECKPQINCKCCSKIAFGIWQKKDLW